MRKVLIMAVAMLVLSAGAHAGYIDTNAALAIGIIGNINLSQARMIDPILSTIVQGYSQSDLVGSTLFPSVPVDVSGGQIIEFGKEAFMQYDTRRAPGGATKRISAGFMGRPYAVENHALEALVPYEIQREAITVPHIDLAALHVKLVQEIHLTTLEVQQASIARNAANYDVNHKLALSGTSKWSDPTSKPLADVLAAKEAIRATAGRYPNVLLLSAKAFSALKANEAVQARFQFTSAASVTTDMLANYFDVEKVVVGKAVTSTDAGVFSDIWGTDAILAYVPQTLSTIQQPSFAYTYTLRGHPFVKVPYQDNNRNSWVYGVNFERIPVLTGMQSGFLIQAAA
jgi:hypothetical protein